MGQDGGIPTLRKQAERPCCMEFNYYVTGICTHLLRLAWNSPVDPHYQSMADFPV